MILGKTRQRNWSTSIWPARSSSACARRLTVNFVIATDSGGCSAAFVASAIAATMIALDSQFGKISTDGPDGMRRLVKSNERYDTDSFLNFVTDEADLVSKFPGFEPVLIGYYDADWGEGSEKHWHITARRV